MFKFDGKEFELSDEVYLDRAKEPFITTHHDTRAIRNLVLDGVPTRGFGIPGHDKIFMPFAFNGDPLWMFRSREAYMNQEYPPFTVMYYAIREDHHDVFEMIHGMRITNEEEFGELRQRFNKLYMKLLRHKGSGIRGDASKEEMVRLGSWFYALQLTADNNRGLQLDTDGRFINGWNRKKNIIKLDIKTLSAYSSKLRDVYLSGLPWDAFLFRYANQSDETSFWYINIPTMREGDEGRIHADFTFEDFYTLLADKIHLLSSRKARVMITVPITDYFLEEIIKNFDFIKKTDGSYFSKHFVMHTSLYPHKGSESFAMICNYDPHRYSKPRKHV